MTVRREARREVLLHRGIPLCIPVADGKPKVENGVVGRARRGDARREEWSRGGGREWVACKADTYLGRPGAATKNGCCIWITGWRDLDRLQWCFFDPFWVRGIPLEIA
jgi:hypothetical protein